MAEETPAAPAIAQAAQDKHDRAFAKRAAGAEADSAAIEDERRTRLAESEAANYARALGKPIVKGE